MNLLFRVDASTQIGTGHVMRCLALAQTWQNMGGEVAVVMATGTPSLEARLASEGIKTVRLAVQSGSADDAAQTAYIAHQVGAEWTVVDGYQFGADYQRIIKQSDLYLLFIDDYRHAEYYYADVVLNQNLHAHESLYANHQPYTRMLLGTRYVMLRQEFWTWKGWKRETSEVARKVLVTLGGADPDNVTLKVIQALHQVQMEELEVVVVVGGSNPHYESLLVAIQDSRHSIRLKSSVTNMPELMAWADIAITAGGSTCWELAFMGLPALVVILAANQRPIADGLERAGVAVNAGWHESVGCADLAQAIASLINAPEMRVCMTRHGQELVDGGGAARVLMQIRDNLLGLRQARAEDCRLIWEWNNDPDVRKVSFSPAPIPWDEHLAWFERKLSDPFCVIYIAVNSADVPVGQVRYDLDGDEAVISINLSRQFRGKGYGSRLIGLTSQKLFSSFGVTMIHAYVKPGNEASARAFLKAGFRNAGSTMVRGHSALHFVLPWEE